MSVIVVQCHCGAKYKVAATNVGHRAKCKKCGEAFTVAAKAGTAEPRPNSVPKPPTQRRISASVASPVALPIPAVPFVIPQAVVPNPVVMGYATNPRVVVGGNLSGFFLAQVKAALFVRRFGNVMTFLVAWGVLAGCSFGTHYLLAWGSLRGLCIALLTFLLCEGAFAAFSFNTIHQSAEGEDELPAFPLTAELDEWSENILKPFFAFLGTSFLTLVPAIIYFFAVVVAASGNGVVPVSGFLGVVGLAGLGLFSWPMLILVVAMCGARGLRHIGPMITTVLRTFVPYLLTVFLVYAGAAAWVFSSAMLDESKSSYFVVMVICVGVRALAQTVAMRAVGTYYYYFRDRFGWLED